MRVRVYRFESWRFLRVSEGQATSPKESKEDRGRQISTTVPSCSQRTSASGAPSNAGSGFCDSEVLGGLCGEQVPKK
jgi:hypothetical protein